MKHHKQQSIPNHFISRDMDIKIRRIESDDYVAMAHLFTFPKVVYGTLQIPYPSVDEWKKKLAASCSNPDHVQLCAIVNGELVGSAGLTVGSGVRARHSATFGMAVRDDYQNKGIGKALMTALLDLADNWYNLVRVQLDVYTDNEPAIGLYKKFGFVVEGTLRARAFRDGKYVDCFMMARMHPSFDSKDKGS